MTTNLPGDFLRRLEKIVPAGKLEDVLETFSQEPGAGFRVNTLLADRDAVLSSLREEGIIPEPLSWFEDAFWTRERRRLLETEAYISNEIYVQNLSSMIPALLLDPQPDERVLDLTAAPGSKTHEMACMMEGRGELAAVELVSPRFYKMKALLRQHGASFVRTFKKNGELVWRYRPEYFDRVLLDAPCSTEGRFHVSEPETFSYWSRRKIDEMARKQRRLLYSAVQCVRPGGVLVYSTCTFAPEENEAMVDWALSKFGSGLAIDPIDLPIENAVEPLSGWEGERFSDDVKGALRVLPNERMEGFFVCRFRKTASTLE
ncbi:MAG: RsmB/NOP family class I SAM-dependent RNA methyltransferase [Rhodothermales bacterium]